MAIFLFTTRRSAIGFRDSVDLTDQLLPMNWQNVLRSAINIFSKVNSRQGCHAEYSAQTLCLHAYMMSYSTLAPMFRILNFVIAHSCKTDSTFRDCFRRIGIRPYDWGAGLRLLYCRYAYHFKLS